jgi:hypothetical protein
MRVVVDFPLVPVMARIGIRLGLAPREQHVDHRAGPTLRGRPSEGCRCMRNPGAAFTSTMPPPVSSTEREMSGR